MRTLLRATALLGVCLAVMTSAFASFDMVLKSKDGATMFARAAAAEDGSFKFENIPPGEYVLVVRSPRAAAELKASLRVAAPRESSSGMASGKRMHKPLTITKQWDSARLTASVEGGTISGRIVAE
ncbi:MAG TPA: hypothetical protein VJS92_18575 [Candidatus Polarisedimenticolaceae bacterium]|nr:hypothetical protein [Candidatus Polarisedimenticolaceae bacterium]